MPAFAIAVLRCRRTAAYLSVKASKQRNLLRRTVGTGYNDTTGTNLAQMGAGPLAVQTNAELRKLEGKVPAGPKKEFLKETIDCFGAGANRAFVIMCWILALDHLYDYVMKAPLSAFNEVLAKNADKRVRVTKIQSRDQFGDMPEGKFIEFLRASEIISNDVRKILDEKLGVRNSCAHPSGITVKLKQGRRICRRSGRERNSKISDMIMPPSGSRVHDASRWAARCTEPLGRGAVERERVGIDHDAIV